MKFALHEMPDSGPGHAGRVELAGDLHAADCNCLRSFWDCHVASDATAVEIDMAEVDSLDGPTVAVLTDIVRGHLDAGAEVTVVEAPQMLAHTFYKIGLLDHAALTLIDPRSDEQHYT
jgi:ABC-type transporter Mla MlaB component